MSSARPAVMASNSELRMKSTSSSIPSTNCTSYMSLVTLITMRGIGLDPSDISERWRLAEVETSALECFVVVPEVAEDLVARRAQQPSNVSTDMVVIHGKLLRLAVCSLADEA